MAPPVVGTGASIHERGPRELPSLDRPLQSVNAIPTTIVAMPATAVSPKPTFAKSCAFSPSAFFESQPDSGALSQPPVSLQ
jgi:hypothetical protein